MLPFTLETLPDEILMIILRYSGDIRSIFRTFSGLNQRLNNILVDKRLHLLTDFLYIDVGDANIDYYYQSDLFYDISEQLLSLKTIEDDKQFRQCFQPLVEFHIQQKYHQLGYQIESDLQQFASIRSLLTDQTIHDIDNELEKNFKDLQTCSKPMKNIKRIQSLVRIQGARLDCPDSEYLEYNFAQAVNHLLLANIHTVRPVSPRFIDSLVRMFKLLIISNSNLLKNRAYFVNSGCPVNYFLFCSIYKLQHHDQQNPSEPINIQYYQAAVDLLLFILKCRIYVDFGEVWMLSSFLDLLEMIPLIQLDAEQEIFVYTSQIEIFKILFDENFLKQIIEWDDNNGLEFRRYMGNLIRTNRLDMLLFIHHYHEYVRDFFQNSWNSGKALGLLVANKTRKKMFYALIEDEPFRAWLATCTNMLFILLKQKQCKLVKKFLSLLPLLVHQVDEDDNDPLLYVCLKVRGCRHNLVEYLIKMGCDLQLRNSKDENLIDTLKLERNTKLLKRLIERGTVEIDNESGEMKVIPADEI